MPSTPTDETGSAYLDTVALLQEEIARLEEEIRHREEALPDAPQHRQAGPADEPAGARVAELTALLAERDETIGLLCEQVAALEEAGAAKWAEWEQMERWVRDLEQEIDREATRPRDQDEARRQAEALSEQWEGRERAWAAESARMEAEIAGLRSRLAEAPALAGDHARAALEAENHRLLDECRRLAGFEAAAAEAEALRERSLDLQRLLEQARQALERANNEHRHERIEREAELASLRASLASSKVASIDERINAFRQHLREVHESQERGREERQLRNRLARLWRRSSSH
jgi:hypothetical protein